MMKSLSIVLAGALLVALTAPAGAALVESFEGYTLGAIDGQGAADDTWAGGWSGSGTVVDVSADPLSANGVTGGDKALSMGRVRDNGPIRLFKTDSKPVPTNAAPVYFSYLVRFTNPNSAKAWLFDGGQRWDHSAVGVSNKKARLTSYYGSGGTTSGTDELDTMVDLMIVGCVDGDGLTMWVNPASESDTPALTRAGLGNWSTIDGIGFTSDVNDATLFDNFVGGESFAEVVPEPATMGLLAFGGIAVLTRRRR